MKRQSLGALLMLALAAAPPEARADGHESAAIDDILTIMQDANMVDDEGAERIRAKYATEKKAEKDGLPKLYFSGDLRTRFEHFDIRDNFGSDGFSRSRGRYRIRLNGKAVVNEYVSINFRITSGGAGFEDNIRSTNTTFDGRFNRDDILWDRAYADIKTPWFQVENAGITLQIGKVPNPFINKVGKDFMVWDGDVNPEGVSALAHYSPFEGTEVYLNTGFYIVEENNDEKDPKLTAIQAGFTSEVIPNLELGLRGSGFFYASVDAPGGTSLLGELSDDGNIFAPDTDRVSIVEVRGHMVYSGISGWPITLYGTWAENTNADGINAGVLGNSDGEDTAWGAGIEIGDKKEWVKLGFGWFHIEAR